MVTTASRASLRDVHLSPARLRVPLWVAVACSRLLVLAVGIAGGSVRARIVGWRPFDPTGYSSHLGTLGNLLAATAVRWDSVHYLDIARHGYSNAGNTVFFPLYPFLIHAVAWVVSSDVLAGVVVSAASFALALGLLHRLAREELGPRAADATILLLAFAPLTFFFTAVYAESLFLALSVATFYLARHQRFGLASATAAAAALTRVPGILLMVPVLIMYVQTHRAAILRPSLGRLREMCLLLLPVLALLGFLAYLEARGFGWLAPISNQMTPGHSHSLTGPIITVWRGMQGAALGFDTLLLGDRPVAPGLGGAFTPEFQNLVYFAVFEISLAALILARRRLPPAYTAYAALVLIVCIWSPVPGVPMLSIDRYILVIFPLWMAAAAKLSELRLTAPVLTLAAGMLCFYAYEFAVWVFVA